MPTKGKLLLLAALSAAALLLALPSVAGATLAFVRAPLHATVFAAEDDGSGPHRIGSGSNPHVSPDGQTIAFLREGTGHTEELRLARADGSGLRTLMVGWREPFYLAFSPDSATIAALRGPELGKRKLVLIDIATGSQRVVARGIFSGFSFSPDGTELVYSRAGGESYPPHSDVFRVGSAGGKPVQITDDHRSLDPLWGPTGTIVFVKMVDAKKRRYGPKSELFLMNPQGKQVKRLTHTKVDPLLQGLFPTDWSGDGRRLLAEFEGQDTSYAVAVNPRTGSQHPIVTNGEKCPKALNCEGFGKEPGGRFVGTALSSDGTMVLGFSGGFEPGPNHDVVALPYSRGKPEILAKNAFEPDWSR
jgi:dipeptidyl aminopeptidase/acylaminoacyl peptidase